MIPPGSTLSGSGTFADEACLLMLTLVQAKECPSSWKDKLPDCALTSFQRIPVLLF